jgi:hypothetical protein
MTEPELTAAETAVLTAIESSPGIPARDLSEQLHRRTQVVLRTVESLVRKGLVERRPVERTHEYVKRGRSESRTRAYNGLFCQKPVVDPSLCPGCGARRRHFEGGPECRYIAELRALGAGLDWQRVPLGPGKVIQTGPMMWGAFLDRAPMVDLIAAQRQARFHLDLASISRQNVTASA